MPSEEDSYELGAVKIIIGLSYILKSNVRRLWETAILLNPTSKFEHFFERLTWLAHFYLKILGLYLQPYKPSLEAL